MKKKVMTKLLRLIARGRNLEECWRDAGYSSMEEAVEDLKTLIRILGSAKGSDLPSYGAENMHPFLVVYVDGGSRGNPGPSAAAAIAYLQSGEQAGTRKVFLGKKTNNEAEYLAVIEGLKLAKMLGAANVLLKMDSELVYKQLVGAYRVKNERLRVLFDKVQELLEGFEEVLMEHIGRKKNREADGLVNSILDETAEAGRQ